MDKPLSLLVAAAECTPLAKTGGLADVVGTLPTHLKRLGFDARVIIPYHRVIKEKYQGKAEHLCSFSVQLGWRSQYVGVERIFLGDVPVYLIDNEFYFGDRIYRGGDSECEQYAFFTRAVLEALPMIGFVPDIIQANDWHTAMLPMLIKTQYCGRAQGGIKTLLTIHNLAYQGKTGFERVSDLLSIDLKYYTPEFMEAYGCANFLKAGCVFADRISTVSPTYAREIRMDYYGEGLSGILNAREHQLRGILNGIDTESFNPEKDKNIPANYSVKDMSGKAKCKKSVLFELGLHENAPLIATVSRLTPQKGFDLVMRELDDLMRENILMVVLGQGDREYESFFRAAEERYKGRLCAYIGYNEALAHRIYAGADFLLMPSRFEPCGLSQMMAMRYGTLPIVRETGGLCDTVKPYNRYTGEGNGFSFVNYNAHEMADAVRRACMVYYDEKALAGLISAAMRCDFSFARSAAEYAKLFREMM